MAPTAAALCSITGWGPSSTAAEAAAAAAADARRGDGEQWEEDGEGVRAVEEDGCYDPLGREQMWVCGSGPEVRPRGAYGCGPVCRTSVSVSSLCCQLLPIGDRMSVDRTLAVDAVVGEASGLAYEMLRLLGRLWRN